MELDSNQLASGDLVCNSIYTYPEQPKSRLYVYTGLKIYVVVLMSTFSIPNIGVTVYK